MKLPALIVAALALSAIAAGAQDRADIDRTRDHRQSRVAQGALHRAVEETAARRTERQAAPERARRPLAPVDRDVFRRHVHYDQQLNAPKPAAATTAAAAR